MNKISQIKEAFEMKRKADVLQKEMAKIKVTVYEGDYELTMTGDQKIESILENGEKRPELEKLVNKGFKEIQKELQKKMRNQLSDFKF